MALNFKNVSATINSQTMLSNYKITLDNVTNMIEAINKDTINGPIYTTWIRFQLGKTQDIIFDNRSTDKKQNLIASLTMEKKGVGVVNSFSLNIKYDPFNYGQDVDRNKLDELDRMIADIMSYDLGDNANTNGYRGFIQYGYNYADDARLSSPKYQFIMTGANSRINWETGIIEYTFEGTSELAADCEFSTSYPEKENTKLLQIVIDTLYKYFGDPNNKPAHLSPGVTCEENEYKYKIIVSDSVFNDSPVVSVPAASDSNPWTYCRNLLLNQMSASDAKREVYQNKNLKESQKPQYCLFTSDEADNKAIYITYISPLDDNSNMKLNYTFSWGLQQTSVVVQWEPNVDLRYYLMVKSLRLRQLRTGNVTDEARKYMEANNYTESSIVPEFYDATLTTLGIPADIPIATEITIKATVLEAESRTSGVYMVKGCTDTITNTGLFTSTLKLWRVRGLYDKYNLGQIATLGNTEQTSTYIPQGNDTSGADSGFSKVVEQDNTNDKLDDTPNLSNGDGSGGGFSTGQSSSGTNPALGILGNLINGLFGGNNGQMGGR